MTGYSLKALIEETGYFHLWLTATKRDTFFQSEFDKSFFLLQLQRLLSSKGKGAARRLPIELLAFSITSDGAHLLVYTSRKSLLEYLCNTLIYRYKDYLTRRGLDTKLQPILIVDGLAGAHEALDVSRKIHLLHDAQPTSRYSSIEYYLGERQATWIRPQRLTELFQHSPDNYRKLLKSRPTENDRIFDFIEA